MQCTAKSKRTGQRCKARAVTGKDVCYHHGGATPVKHGLYSKYSKTKLADKIEQLKADPSLTDLREHIALMTALLTERLNQTEEVDEGTAADLILLAEKLTKAIERWHKVTYGEKHILKIEEVQTLVTQIVVIIREEVGDQSTVERIARRLQNMRIKGA